jgi:hypothetical protein
MDEIQTDESATYRQESLMDIGSALIPNSQTTITVQPGQRSFDDPTMSTKSFTTLNSSSGDPSCNAAFPQDLAIVLAVITFVRIEFLRTLSRSAPFLADGRDGIHHRFQHGRFVHMSASMPYRERDASPFDHKMALRSRFAAIRWIRAGGFAPPGAGTMPASKLARDQSNCSASERLSNNLWCSRSHTPAFCQSLNRRQQVIPLPQPISWGNISQGRPLRSTNRIPAKAARLETRGLPPFGFSGSLGSRGSIVCQSSSVTNCFAMPQSYQFLGFC